MEICPTCGAVKKQPGLSPAQLGVLEIIKTFISDHGYSPSLDELAGLHHTNKSNVYRHVKRLISRGYLLHLPFRQRTLTVV